MENHQKFLEFNGRNIVLLSIDGTYWIALKSICEALGVNMNRSYQNAKLDPILGPALAIQQVQVSKNGKKQLRNMTCIPEEFVYGWIFTLNSESELLTEYKRTCYKLLYNHFHGTITNRKELLMERREISEKIAKIKTDLKEQSESFKELAKLDKLRKNINTELNSFDRELIKQPELFEIENNN